MVSEAVVCPKCGYQQEEPFACLRCGVIFHKYKATPRPSRSPTGSRENATHAVKTTSRGKVVFAFALTALAVFLLLRWYGQRPIVHGPGMIAPHQPKQINVKQRLPFRHLDYVITPLAIFELEARVLGIKRYRFDKEADLVPYDVALGWGPMSDERVLKALTITQSDRFYAWWSEQIPLPAPVINVSSANMHLIPANRDIAKRLRRVRRGHVVSIKGFLVRADAGNWHLISSLTRQDTGAGACELIWVQDLAVR